MPLIDQYESLHLNIKDLKDSERDYLSDSRVSMLELVVENINQVIFFINIPSK
jgi:hypothetical protein